MQKKGKMFKILIVGGLIYILYNMILKRPLIPGGKMDKKIDDQPDVDDGEYVDYEEVD